MGNTDGGDDGCIHQITEILAHLSDEVVAAVSILEKFIESNYDEKKNSKKYNGNPLNACGRQ
eukprot:10885965-Ditylum_brightwellii.AAC.1